MKKARVEFTDSGVYKIVGDQLYENGVPDSTGTGRWDSDSVYACYMPLLRAWYVMEFVDQKDVKTSAITKDPALLRPTVTEIKTEVVNGGVAQWQGTLPSGIP